MPEFRDVPDGEDLASIKALGSLLSEEDFVRDEPPSGLWDEIAAAMQPPRVVPLSRRRSKYQVYVGVAAATVAGLIITGAVLRSGDERADVIASADLTNAGLSPLGANASGHADIVKKGSAHALRLAVRDVPTRPSAYTEVWMIDAEVKGMVSLGPFHGNGDYVIPSGVDPGKFPVVDVSLEPSDGVPTHSGVSIVRGVTA